MLYTNVLKVLLLIVLWKISILYIHSESFHRFYFIILLKRSINSTKIASKLDNKQRTKFILVLYNSHASKTCRAKSLSGLRPKKEIPTIWCVCMCIESRHQLITLYNKYCKMGACNSRMLLMQNVHANRLSQIWTALQIAFQELCIA